MPTAASIVDELDRLLGAGQYGDWCLNGLQVPGGRDVEHVVTGVSANLALIEAAVEANADLVLVHHGLFWDPGVRAIDPVLHRRLSLLYGADAALAAYHLPLDADPVYGNNVLLAKALGADASGQFAEAFGRPIGLIAEIAPLDIDELAGRIAAQLAREPQVLGAGPPEIRRLAVLTGAGADSLTEAAAAGADVLVTGEISERSPALAEELGIHLVAAGHHATERAGVRALGEELVQRHGIAHTFIDVENPV